MDDKTAKNNLTNYMAQVNVISANKTYCHGATLIIELPKLHKEG